CPACNWAFEGWAGSKEKMWRSPPDFFLPVTESLHQWQHDPECGRLFGDDRDFTAPRAVLADEVHLYSHVPGMQVGYTLQRLLAGAQVNGGRRPLAVGMSATLSAAADVWGRLAGRPGQVEAIAPGEGECEDTPKGREYFYFLQPEVESRGQLIAGETTTI